MSKTDDVLSAWFIRYGIHDEVAKCELMIKINAVVSEKYVELESIKSVEEIEKIAYGSSEYIKKAEVSAILDEIDACGTCITEHSCDCPNWDEGEHLAKCSLKNFCVHAELKKRLNL